MINKEKDLKTKILDVCMDALMNGESSFERVVSTLEFVKLSIFVTDFNLSMKDKFDKKNKK